MPVINRIWRTNGVADQFAISAAVEYADEPERTVTFVSSVQGGPIVMITNINGTDRQVFVDNRVRERCGGKLTEDWVRAFFVATPSESL